MLYTIYGIYYSIYLILYAPIQPYHRHHTYHRKSGFGPRLHIYICVSTNRHKLLFALYYDTQGTYIYIHEHTHYCYMHYTVPYTTLDTIQCTLYNILYTIFICIYTLTIGTGHRYCIVEGSVVFRDHWQSKPCIYNIMVYTRQVYTSISYISIVYITHVHKCMNTGINTHMLYIILVHTSHIWLL